MTSVADHLNDLLYRERGELESVRELIKEIARTDSDIAESARDALETAQWSCQGLHHRIERIGGIPTSDAADLAERLSDLPDTKAKVELICGEQEQDFAKVESLLKSSELDDDTRSFLNDLLKAHQETKRWCETVLSEWRVER